MNNSFIHLISNASPGTALKLFSASMALSEQSSVRARLELSRKLIVRRRGILGVKSRDLNIIRGIFLHHYSLKGDWVMKLNKLVSMKY